MSQQIRKLSSFFDFWKHLQQTKLPKYSYITQPFTVDVNDYSDKDKLMVDSFQVIVSIPNNIMEKKTDTDLHLLYKQAFFMCPVFKLERKILKMTLWKAPKTSDQEILTTEFKQPYIDGVSIFRLVEKRKNEIPKNVNESHEYIMNESLFEWEKGTGRTWFGSSIIQCENENALQIYFGSGLRLKHNETNKLKSVIIDLVYPLHILYSKILLASAAQQLNKDLRQNENIK